MKSTMHKQPDKQKLPQDKCHWYEDGAAWATQCGEYFEITNGTPAENGMMFCPYCGRPIDQEVP